MQKENFVLRGDSDRELLRTAFLQTQLRFKSKISIIKTDSVLMLSFEATDDSLKQLFPDRIKGYFDLDKVIPPQPLKISVFIEGEDEKNTLMGLTQALSPFIL